MCNTKDVCVWVGIVAYRHFAKLWLYNQESVLGNARKVHERNNRGTVFSVVRAAAVSGKRFGKHVSAVMDTNATIK
jgi:hypothetical protein